MSIPSQSGPEFSGPGDISSDIQESRSVTTMKSLSLLPNLRQADSTKANAGIELPELIAIIRRRKWLIAGVTSVIFAGALAGIVSLTERFTATTAVLIEPSAGAALDINAIVSGFSADAETIQSQIEIMKSRRLAGRVVEKLELWSHHEYTSDDLDGGFSLGSILPIAVVDALPFLGGDSAEAAFESENDLRARLVTQFLKSLTISGAGRSRVIDITFESEDRLLAALASNTVAELYIVDELESRFEAIQGATTWINNRVTQLRDQVAQSERAVEEWRSANGIVETAADGGGTVIRQQITTINDQLAIARGDLAESQAKVSAIERARTSPIGLSSLPDIIASEAVQQLSAQAADIRQRLALNESAYGPRHPIMISLQAELGDVDRRMANEINVILEGTRNQARIGRARVDELTRTLSTLDGQSALQSEALVHLATLKSIAGADRLLLESFLEKSNITGNTDLSQSNARIISPAEVPNVAAFPNRKLMAVGSLGFALAFALALAFLLERLEGGFRSSEEIERSLGVPGLGLIPEVRSVPGFKRVLEEVVLDNPLSHYAEALRRLYTTVLLQEGDPKKSSIVFTSAMPGEGKTTVVVALGRVIAAMGRRVVVIDCDFRRPRLHKALGASTNGRGLMQLLLDNDEVSDVLEEDPRSGLHFIKAGTDFVRPMNLLESPRFREVLAELRERYDIVLIDAPPVLAVSDGLMLASRADQTVIVAKWHDTQREAIGTTVKQVAEAGANIAGVVLNQVNVSKNSNYRYGDSMLYTKQFSKYYTQ